MSDARLEEWFERSGRADALVRMALDRYSEAIEVGDDVAAESWLRVYRKAKLARVEALERFGVLGSVMRGRADG